MRTNAIRGMVVVAVTAGWLAASSATAIAAPASPAEGAAKAAPPGITIVQQSGDATVSAPSATGLTKDEWLARYDIPVAIPAAETMTSNGSAPVAGGNSLSATGYTSLSGACGLTSCTANFTDTHASFTMYGTNPYNADQINGSVKWWVDGINASVNVSWPPGIGFSQNNGTVIWAPGAVSNQWKQTLDYAGRIKIVATSFWNQAFTAQADFQVGNAWYHVQGD